MYSRVLLIRWLQVQFRPPICSPGAVAVTVAAHRARIRVLTTAPLCVYMWLGCGEWNVCKVVYLLLNIKLYVSFVLFLHLSSDYICFVCAGWDFPAPGFMHSTGRACLVSNEHVKSCPTNAPSLSPAPADFITKKKRSYKRCNDGETVMPSVTSGGSAGSLCVQTYRYTDVTAGNNNTDTEPHHKVIKVKDTQLSSGCTTNFNYYYLVHTQINQINLRPDRWFRSSTVVGTGPVLEHWGTSRFEVSTEHGITCV